MDYISQEEKDVVHELKKRTIDELTPKMREDDTVFYRFAKARDFNLVEAETMLRKDISWRKEWEIDSILTDYDPPEVLCKYGISSFVCFDNEGCPVRLQDFGHVDDKGLVNCVTKEEMAKYCVYVVEQDREKFIKRGGNFRKPYSFLIYDFEDMTYSKAINVKAVQMLLYSLKVLIDHYPESVKTIQVINAPICFSLPYAAIKPILPPVITQKIHIHGSDGWKEALLKHIEADDLPGYLGGNKTDPDGNPLCKTFIQRGKPIPKRYFKKNDGRRLLLASQEAKVSVKPLAYEEISFEIKEENSSLEWRFEVKNGDIDFSLKFSDEFSENLEEIILIPKKRICTSMEAEKGYIECERMGIYTIVFDNSYSWLHTKEVFCTIEIRNPKTQGII